MEQTYSVHSHTGVYARIFKDTNRNEILLIKKIRGPYTGMNDLPGGGLQLQETIQEALLREIQEEVGCSVVSFRELGEKNIQYKYINNEKLYVLEHTGIFFEVEIEGIPKEDADGEDSGGCIWIPVKKLTKETATPFVFEILKK